VNPLGITKNRGYLVEALGTSGKITSTKASTVFFLLLFAIIY